MGRHQMMAVLDATLREEKAKAAELSDPGGKAFATRIKKIHREFQKAQQTAALVSLKVGEDMAAKKEDARFTAEVTFRIKGIPAKDVEEALEKFRKYLGNNLRETDSPIRKKFLKTVVVQKED